MVFEAPVSPHPEGSDMTDDARGVYADDEFATRDAPDSDAPADAGEPPQYGVGPFSLREVVIGGIWLVAFVLSFLPVFGAASLWSLGLTWILTIGVPTAAVFLLVLRRLSPDGIRRVGSLGIDQFASVAFSVAAVYWLTLVWQQVSITVNTGITSSGSWLIWVEFILMVAGVVFTVFAPLLPVFGEDFRHRPESLAHPNARRLRPVTARPPRPARPEPVPTAPAAPAAETVAPAAPEIDDSTAETSVFEPFDFEPQTGESPDAVDDASATTTGETVVEEQPVTAQPTQSGAPQAFWALAPEERDVLDASGTPIFRVGPTAWALVIEDRGEVFVVRHEDGRVGYLHDVTGVTRG